MPPTPRPADWKGGSEDFGFERTFDGHIAIDHFATQDEDRYGDSNVRNGFAQADIGGEYDPQND